MRTDRVRWRRSVSLAGLLVTALLVPTATGAGVVGVSRASVATGGAQAMGGNSLHPAISADGRFVAFDSEATNLVPGDTNGKRDVFVYDRATGTTTRVSVASDGSQATGGFFGSIAPALSADGRFVSFISDASNLVPGKTNNVCDTNGDMVFTDPCPDIYVHDRLTGITTRVSVASDGTEAQGFSFGRGISADGRFVVFESDAANLVAGDTNGAKDVFIHDRLTHTTTRVSVASDGTQANGRSQGGAMSADGRFVAFQSKATNLSPGDLNGDTDVFLHDRTTGTTIRISGTGTPAMRGDGPRVSADGRFVTFPGPENPQQVPGGACGVSPHDMFIYDRLAGTTTFLATAGDQPVPSADGRFVAYLFYPNPNPFPNAFPGQYRVLDRSTGNATTVSVASDGTPSNGGSFCNIFDPAGGTGGISADGRLVVFDTNGSNLVPGDTNGFADVFVARLTWDKTFTVPPCRVLDTRVSAPPGPIPGGGARSIRVAGSLAALGQGGAADCAVPIGATGVYVNVVAVGAAGPGHLTIYPAGSALPLASTLNFSTGDTIANGVLVPLCIPFATCPADLTIQMGPAATDVVIDVAGYQAVP